MFDDVDFLILHMPLAVISPAYLMAGVTPWRLSEHKAAEQLRLIQGSDHEKRWWLTMRSH